MKTQENILNFLNVDLELIKKASETLEKTVKVLDIESLFESAQDYIDEAVTSE